MHRSFTAAMILALAVAPAILLSGCAGQSAESSSPRETPPRDPHALVAEGATLLDVRTQAEYDARHLEGAVLIPVDQVAARSSEIPRDRPVVVYCQSGARAERAATVLREGGFDVVVLGGIADW
jgi:rhodanese-related sulfurtransferase